MATISPRSASALIPRPILAWVVGISGLVALALAGLAAAAGFFDSDAVHVSGMDMAGSHPVVAVYFSGDMGLRVGMARHVIPALIAANIPVFGIASPTAFATRKTQSEVDAMVASSIRDALARSRADRVVLIGQSFGSDIIAAGVSALPRPLRGKVAAMILVVPGRSVYFRADPTGLGYHGAPDADAATALRTVDWAPVTCIYGEGETDSPCPGLIGTGASVMELPGGHFLNRDHVALTAAIFTALRPVLRHNQELGK